MGQDAPPIIAEDRAAGPLPPLAAADGLAALVLIAGGLAFHWPAAFWGIAFVGERQYGDAEFWWNGAVHLARGIVADNPGGGYRPGYFLLTGPFLAVLGTDFLAYHKLLALVFLAASVLAYLALRDALGRPGAFCGIALLVFNPFTAEWISTSTTDGTGLVLHLAALASFVLAFHGAGSPRWLAAFALFFSLATLTRPITTPFVGFALVLVLLSFRRGPGRNALTALGAAVVFLLPLGGWLTVQRATVGQWSVSSNDASAFYAASDPAIQVWNNEMHRAVEASAQRRLGRAVVDRRDLHEEFWRLTVENYRIHWRYHLARLLPHVWEVARFGPHQAVRGSTTYRSALLGLYLLATAASLAAGRRWPRAALALVILVVSVTQPWFAPVAVIAGALMGAIGYAGGLATGRGDGLGMAAIAGYWLTGAVALALIGGTWSAAGPTAVTLNALGYRVGSQVFFAGDLLILGALRAALGPAPTPEALRCWIRPHDRLSRLARLGFAALGAVLLATLVFGALIVAGRAWASARQRPQPYPSLDPVAAAVPGALVVARYSDLVARLGIGAPAATVSPTVVTTGTGTEFLWNLPAQERAQLLVYHQERTRPFAMHPRRLHVEFPRHERPADWAYRQGAWVLKRVANRPKPGSNLPYYTSETAVRGFVPLSDDGMRYELGRARWFPLAVYASQLEANGLLAVAAGKAEWRADSGASRYPRRVILTADVGGEIRLGIDLGRFVGVRELGLEWFEGAGTTSRGRPGVARQPMLQIEVHAGRRLAAASAYPPRTPVRVELAEPGATAVFLRFSGVSPPGVEVHELTVVAEDLTER